MPKRRLLIFAILYSVLVPTPLLLGLSTMIRNAGDVHDLLQDGATCGGGWLFWILVLTWPWAILAVRIIFDACRGPKRKDHAAS